MKKKQKEYKPDDRICIFYVTDRIHDLQHIKDELLHNIAIDVMIKRST